MQKKPSNVRFHNLSALLQNIAEESALNLKEHYDAFVLQVNDISNAYIDTGFGLCVCVPVEKWARTRSTDTPVQRWNSIFDSIMRHTQTFHFVVVQSTKFETTNDRQAKWNFFVSQVISASLVPCMHWPVRVWTKCCIERVSCDVMSINHVTAGAIQNLTESYKTERQKPNEIFKLIRSNHLATDTWK